MSRINRRWNPILLCLCLACALSVLGIACEDTESDAQYDSDDTSDTDSDADADADSDADGDPFEYVAYGDTRSNPGKHREMVGLFAPLEPELVLHVGDLWDGYSPGEFKDIITSHAHTDDLLSQNLFLAAKGNHETENQVLNFDPPIVRDGDTNYAFLEGNTFFVCARDAPQNHIDFISEALQTDEAQDAAWRVVFSHVPVYSSGGHHHSGSTELEAAFDQYGVDLFFSGHTHLYERTHQVFAEEVVSTDNDMTAGAGTVYIVTGGGGVGHHRLGEFFDVTYTSQRVWHFVHISATRNTLKARVIDDSGADIDAFTISR